MDTPQKAYWFVGATWGGEDQSERFISGGTWENGYEDKFIERVQSMTVGERIAIKASYTRKHGLPFDNRDRAVSVMSIKAVGTITANKGDGHVIQVDWTIVDPVREWYFFTYQPAVWKVVQGSSWLADALIAFAFDGQKQDYDRFRNEPYWRDRYGSPEDIAAAEERPILELWPSSKQLKGISATSGYMDGYREAVSMTLGGVERDEFVDLARNSIYFGKYSPQSCRNVFSNIRRIGLIEPLDGGLWHPSKAGEIFLEEEIPNQLVRNMLERVFGVAHALQYISGKSPVEKKSIFEYLRSIYPQWTTDFATSSITAWIKSLGLITDDVQYNITAYGRYWASALPGTLQIPALQTSTVTSLSHDKAVEARPWPSLQQVVDCFATDPDLAKYVFSGTQIQSLHVAWHCLKNKRFVILSGLSGTGKTALLRHYARIYCTLSGLDPDEHCAVVAVSPDWRDPSGLLGYLNALHADPTFQAEPGLRVVLGAAHNPGLPYFLILDEMNMARVEKYFAPFLSAMEIDGALVLHSNDEHVNDVPPSVPWPRNLFVGGTVNMDETTHPFSDKVLDRAFTFEFWDVSLEEFFDRKPVELRLPFVEALLLQLQEELKPIRRHFGYRVAEELLAFVRSCADNGLGGESDICELLDQAIFSKVLPRIRGEENPPFVNALAGVERVCREHDLGKSADKVKVMQQQLAATGITRFWA